MLKVFNKKFLKENYILIVFVIYVAAKFLYLNFSLTKTNDTVHDLLNIIKLASCAIFAFDAAWDIITRRRQINILLVTVSACAVITFLFSKNATMITLILLIYEMAKFNFKKVLNLVYWTILVCYVGVVCLALLEYVPNWVFTRKFSPKLRYALGFTYASPAFTIFTFLLLMRCYLKNFKLSSVENMINLLSTVCIYKFTDSRTSFLICLLLIAIVFLIKIPPFNKINLDKYLDKKIVKITLLALPIILLILWEIATMMYQYGIIFGGKIDHILSGRILYSTRAFNEQSLTLFGSNIDWDGWGEYAYLKDKSTFDYNCLDNSYMYILFNFGIVSLIISIALYTYLMCKAIKEKDYSLIFVFIIVLINSMIEANLIELTVNWFVLYAGSLFIKKKENLILPKDKVMNNILEQKNKVVAVVVTYNRKQLLRESILALMSQKYYNVQILVVDNNSTDGTKEYISDLVDSIKVFYINTGKNLGGSGGFNYGMKQAMKMQCDYIWIMDDDCIVKEDSLIKLVEFAQSKNDDFGFLSSYVEWKDGSPCKMNVQRSGLKTLISDFKQDQKIELASFVSLLVKPTVVEEVGLPIKDFFIWGDDWEYTYRIAKKYKCYFVADSVVTHKSTYNIGSDISKDDYEKLSRYFYSYRNEKYFYRCTGFKGRCYHFAKIILHVLRILFSKIDHKKERLNVLFKGLKAGRKFNPPIEYVTLGDKPINVLEFFGEPLSYGGQEAFMVNMYKNFERSNIKYTFATPFYCDNQTLIDLAKNKGDVIVAFNKRFNTTKRKKHILSCAKELLKNNKYDVIHIQSSSLFTLLQVAKIAKKNKVNKIIVHSHATGNNNFKYKLIKKYSDLFIDKYIDKYLACSDLAAKWKFPKNIVEENNYVVIKNGIDLNKFQFDKEKRKTYRQTFGIKDEIVLCNVGRFAQEKNHSFMIEIAKGLKEKEFNFKFILVGDGDDKETIKQKIKEYQLEDKFILLEKRGDVAEIMMASDIFVMPSWYEGFPVTLIESQTTGLKSLSSDTVTKEAKITDIIAYLPINDSSVWVDEILNMKEFKQNRESYRKVIEDAGFGANVSARLLEKIYLNED